MDSGTMVQLIITAFLVGVAWMRLEHKVGNNGKETKKLSDYHFAHKLYLEKKLTETHIKIDNNLKFVTKRLDKHDKLLGIVDPREELKHNRFKDKRGG